MWLLYLVNGLQSSITGNLSAYVTSGFESHSLIPVISIVSSVMSAATYMPLAKVLNLWDRSIGFLIMVAFATLGLILSATCHDIGTYCAAQVGPPALPTKHRLTRQRYSTASASPVSFSVSMSLRPIHRHFATEVSPTPLPPLLISSQRSGALLRRSTFTIQTGDGHMAVSLLFCPSLPCPCFACCAGIGTRPRRVAF
jgi:hypothetical protein